MIWLLDTIQGPDYLIALVLSDAIWFGLLSKYLPIKMRDKFVASGDTVVFVVIFMVVVKHGRIHDSISFVRVDRGSNASNAQYTLGNFSGNILQSITLQKVRSIPVSGSSATTTYHL